VFCGRYIRIMGGNTHVHLSKQDWSRLLDLAKCLHIQRSDQIRQAPKWIVDWRKKCFESKSFSTQIPSISVHYGMN
jgi:propanediol utilization protein